ncbi:MAG TPA: HDOD domain-containing protein, partial [Burkholderiales bacterium]
ELAQVEERFLRGTPAYMAPEYIQGAPYTQACDLFALGMMLYALVVGAPAVSGSDYAAVLQRMRVGIWQRPSERTSAVDERLDRLIMQAIAADPAQRFADAAAFSAALENYLDPAAAHKPESEEAVRGKQGTLDFLLRRMRHGSDFPALSSTISSVNQALSAENERASVLCNTILKDFALTNKLLKLVNAVHYNHFGGRVSTVSRAVAILGFDGVRNVALSLVLLEHLQNKSQATALKEEVTATYFSGVMARQLVQRLGVQDAEYAFICAMFHRLGKLLAVFYLHDEAQAVERLREARDIDEARASAEVLGISYEELGIGVAREWKFPDEIVDSMRHVTEPLRSRELSAIDRMRALSTLSNELCETVRAPEEERPLLLSVVVQKFGRGLKINEKLLQTVISESAAEVAREVALLGMSTGKSRLLAAARESDMAIASGAAQADGDTLETVIADALLSGNAASAIEGNVPAAEMRRSALSAGVQDITNTLVGDYELNDVLRIILETMYRAIGFKRVLLLVRDQRAGVLRARFGFGDDVNDVIKRGFAVPLNGARDIFYAAISQGADLCIEDLEAEKIRPHVPQWYRKLITAHGMVLFPVLVNHRPVALIYADADVPEVLHFQPEELNLLKTLRNQAVLAIKQKS